MVYRFVGLDGNDRFRSVRGEMHLILDEGTSPTPRTAMVPIGHIVNQLDATRHEWALLTIEKVLGASYSLVGTKMPVLPLGTNTLNAYDLRRA